MSSACSQTTRRRSTSATQQAGQRTMPTRTAVRPPPLHPVSLSLRPKLVFTYRSPSQSLRSTPASRSSRPSSSSSGRPSTATTSSGAGTPTATTTHVRPSLPLASLGSFRCSRELLRAAAPPREVLNEAAPLVPLDSPEVVLLVGPPAIGKTSYALQLERLGYVVFVRLSSSLFSDVALSGILLTMLFRRLSPTSRPRPRPHPPPSRPPCTPPSLMSLPLTPRALSSTARSRPASTASRSSPPCARSPRRARVAASVPAMRSSVRAASCGRRARARPPRRRRRPRRTAWARRMTRARSSSSPSTTRCSASRRRARRTSSSSSRASTGGSRASRRRL